jgi:acyl-CoA reductase-like NAD-dependent aldehyde dehydrogenase
MKQDNNFQRWYDDSQNRNKLFDIPNATEDRLCAHLPNRSSKTLLETAFEEAKAKFAADLTQDRRKTEFASLTTSLRDLQDEISKLVTKYEARNKESKARKWLERLSHRIHFYGTVLDVVAQHHPEYVALTWGSIKFLILVGVSPSEYCWA